RSYVTPLVSLNCFGNPEKSVIQRFICRSAAHALRIQRWVPSNDDANPPDTQPRNVVREFGRNRVVPGPTRERVNSKGRKPSADDHFFSSHIAPRKIGGKCPRGVAAGLV